MEISQQDTEDVKKRAPLLVGNTARTRGRREDAGRSTRQPSAIILVTGSRDWTDRNKIYNELSKYSAGSTIVHGAARGADQLAASVARQLDFNVIPCPADWNKHGKAAGPIRNKAMLDEYKPNIVIAFPTKSSVGTWDCVGRARRMGIPVKVVS